MGQNSPDKFSSNRHSRAGKFRQIKLYKYNNRLNFLLGNDLALCNLAQNSNTSIESSQNQQSRVNQRSAMCALGKGEVILIIDDEECMTDSCCQVLTKAGYCVETAMDGEAGLAKARAIEPDLALVDLDMPGVSGLEVMDELSEIRSDIINIVVTGNTSVDLEKEVIQKNRALAYLKKPFSPEELNFVVRKALDTKDQKKGKGGLP